jgi:hypothetical protein
MPRYHVVGPIGPETIDYGIVPAADPPDALYTVQRDGLGPRAVRLKAGRFAFSHPADRELCAGGAGRAGRLVSARGPCNSLIHE